MKNFIRILLVVMALVVLSLAIIGPEALIVAEKDNSVLYAGKVPVPLPKPTN